MDSFIIELVSNAFRELFPDSTLSSFTHFLPEQVKLEGQWEVAISELSFPSMYQKITEGKFKFLTEDFQKLRQPTFWNLVCTLPSQILWKSWIPSYKTETTTTESCFTVKAPRRMQKVVIALANDISGPAFCSTDLGHAFGNNVGNEFGVLMTGEGRHEFGYDIVLIHSLMISSDKVEYNTVGDTKAPLLRCFHFISKLKGWGIITTGQYMN